MRRATPLRPRFAVRGTATASEKLAVLPFGTVAKLWEELEKIAEQAGVDASAGKPSALDLPPDRAELFVEADGFEARYSVDRVKRTILIHDIQRVYRH
jgi:hypothetical protein